VIAPCLKKLSEFYDVDKFLCVQRYFSDHGVNLSYVPRRGWRFYCIGRTDGPTYVVCWVSIGSLVEMCDAPDDTIRAIHEKGGKVILPTVTEEAGENNSSFPSCLPTINQ
jgi:hypothetical protein